jgi:outer membrane protein
MSVKKAGFLTVFFLFFVLFGTAVYAERPGEIFEYDRVSQDVFKAGFGVAFSDSPYKGVDLKVTPIPVLSYSKGNFYINGITAGYVLWETEKASIDAILKPRFDGYQDDDSSDLDGMGDRHPGLDMGIAWNYKLSWASLKAEFLADIIGESDGQEFNFSISRRFANVFSVEGLALRPSGGFRVLSTNLADHYYGVEDDDVAITRPEYKADSTVNWFVGLGIDYKISEKWSFFSNVNYELLGSEIKGSPIVEDDAVLSVMLGLMYEFD